VATAVKRHRGKLIIMYFTKPMSRATPVVSRTYLVVMSTARGQRPPPSRVPKPPADADSGMRMMKNLLRLLLLFGVMPMAVNMGRMAKSMMMVMVAS
jgi:hypothetical protein